MKLHNFAAAPNPRKVRVYLAEKGIDVATVTVNLVQGEHRTPEFLARNPFGAVPVLELDDGTSYPESLAIIEYFEELHPDPPMLGTTPEERMRVRGLERACDGRVFHPVSLIVQHAYPPFAAFFNQRAEVAEFARETLARSLAVMNDIIGDHAFVAGDRPTVADCTLYAGLRFGFDCEVGLDLAPYGNVQRWYEQFGQRPSAQA